MAIGVLIDTNIFLEVALAQGRDKFCRAFLEKHTGELCLSDFGFHSAGVVLLRKRKSELYGQFLRDVDEGINILTLPIESFTEIIRIHRDHQLDFDDSYQLATAEHFNLDLVTMDNDFRGVRSKSKITFLS